MGREAAAGCVQRGLTLLAHIFTMLVKYRAESRNVLLLFGGGGTLEQTGEGIVPGTLSASGPYAFRLY